MTEKERSEDMSKLDSIRSSLKCLELYEILSFVNEQAERAEKLLEQTGHNFEVNRKLEEQNKRYREYLGRLQRASKRYPTEDLPHVINKIVDEALEESE